MAKAWVKSRFSHVKPATSRPTVRLIAPHLEIVCPRGEVKAIVFWRADDNSLLDSDLKRSQLFRGANVGIVFQEDLEAANWLWKYGENKMHHVHQMLIRGVSSATAWETEIFLPKGAASPPRQHIPAQITIQSMTLKWLMWLQSQLNRYG